MSSMFALAGTGTLRSFTDTPFFPAALELVPGKGTLICFAPDEPRTDTFTALPFPPFGAFLVTVALASILKPNFSSQTSTYKHIER